MKLSKMQGILVADSGGPLKILGWIRIKHFISFQRPFTGLSQECRRCHERNKILVSNTKLSA
jgi:hypothetical protein